MWHAILHPALHLIVPGAAARIMLPRKWKTAWLVMLAAMLIDLDHLLADPIYSPDRCSIDFHPMHTYPAIALYGILGLFPKTRLLSAGLLIHIVLDALDCLWMRVFA